MPTKIVNTKSDPKKGEINLADLLKITKDFELSAKIASRTSRPLIKIDTISIPFAIMEHLLDLVSDAEKATA